MVASSSPVNKLRLFSDDHSSNLERNRCVCEVVKLLPPPDLLQSIASIKADYIAQVDERTQFEKEIGIVVPVSNSQKTINRKQWEFGTTNKSLYSKHFSLSNFSSDQQAWRLCIGKMNYLFICNGCETLFLRVSVLCACAHMHL
ncbi:hypothetical protein NC651_004316 [Populus alba x Populus x berolinensis]|nr:hypothetical protein NC651_004316 [Populus alba x Populus x berolinensis]